MFVRPHLPMLVTKGKNLLSQIIRGRRMDGEKKKVRQMKKILLCKYISGRVKWITLECTYLKSHLRTRVTALNRLKCSFTYVRCQTEIENRISKANDEIESTIFPTNSVNLRIFSAIY